VVPITPRAFESVADEPKKPEREEQHERAGCLRQENVSDESPDFAVHNSCRIEPKKFFEAGIEQDEQEDERGERDNGTDQAGNGNETDPPLEFV
jgi:hypothetical protein